MLMRQQGKNEHDSLSLLYQGNRPLTCSSNAASQGKGESHPEITTKQQAYTARPLNFLGRMLGVEIVLVWSQLDQVFALDLPLTSYLVLG